MFVHLGKGSDCNIMITVVCCPAKGKKACNRASGKFKVNYMMCLSRYAFL